MVFKVVSVEDEPEIAELLRIVLGNPEIEIHAADNGRDGLALVRSLKPDLVVLDVMMPGGMNGWDIYDAIRTSPDTFKIPIIVLSVLREKAERKQAFAGSEIDLYMTKPFDTMRLRREVERMLGRVGGGLWQSPRQTGSLPAVPPPAAVVPAVPPPAAIVPVAAPPAAVTPVVPPPAAVVPVPPAASAPAVSTPAESPVESPLEAPVIPPAVTPAESASSEDESKAVAAADVSDKKDG